MKTITFLSLILLSAQAFSATGFYYNSKPLTSYETGSELFAALKAANESDDEVDVCYEGDYSEAISATEKLAKGAITFNLIDVYGESEFPPLDLEFSNDQGESAYGIISSCN